MADWDVKPGEPLWEKSDQPLKNHTRDGEMETTYTLTVWLAPPNDEDATDWGQIFEHIWEEWKVQAKDMKEEAAVTGSAKVNKDDGSDDNKDNDKHT